ncbi:MAG: fructose-6-phosphate aldolase [Flavobacteriales bacterium]|nr:fructose-6-phosphate aldolase [Flavobacteriales bacterium]|tara:strand:+ start:198 stop:407 length:210 start_codon:yes stop_codon:yes gene_type:complete
MLYILKIKGTSKIPDFVQIRDSKMSLLAYFRLDQVDRGLIKNHLNNNEKLKNKILEMPFGKIHKFLSNE